MGHWIAAGRMTGFVSLTKWRRFFSAMAPLQRTRSDGQAFKRTLNFRLISLAS
jgi:hypothetical protein